jgi:hypothetical protein
MEKPDECRGTMMIENKGRTHNKKNSWAEGGGGGGVFEFHELYVATNSIASKQRLTFVLVLSDSTIDTTSAGRCYLTALK